MAGRIRSIKPEMLDDEKTAQLNPIEWRLFVSLILLADDYGNLRATPLWLHGQVFWGVAQNVTPADCALGIQTLVETGLVDSYEVRGQPYLHIIGWVKHQRVDKPGKPRVPQPDDVEAYTPKGVTHLYAVQQGDGGPIKIGRAYDVSVRLKRLQTSSPHPLKLLASAPCGELEREFHKRLSAYRMSGEWFSPCAEVLSEVNKIKAGSIPESFANDSRAIIERPAPDLRPPTTDHDQDHRSICPAEIDKPAPSAPDTESTALAPYVPDAVARPHLAEGVREVVEYYRKKHPGKGRQLKPGHRDWKLIEARYREGFRADELKLAIDGNALDPWHQQNPAGHTVEYVFRNATKVEAFMKTARDGPQLMTRKGQELQAMLSQPLGDYEAPF